MKEQQSILLAVAQMVTIRIVDFSIIEQKLFLNFLQGHFLTLHFVVTLKLKTLIKRSNWQLKRSWSWELPYSNVAPAPTPSKFKCELQLWKSGLLRAPARTP